MAITTLFVPGWNGGANTVATIAGDGYFTFQLGQRTGIIVGLSKTVCEGDYPQIEHAFFVQANAVAIMERGSIKDGPDIRTVEDKTFKIERVRGVVRYYLDNTLLYTSLVPSTGEVWLDAALYAKGDEIIDATATDTAYADPTPTDPEDPEYDQRTVGDGWIRFTGWADSEGIDFADGRIRLSSNAESPDWMAGDGQIRVFGYAGEADSDFARGGMRFQSTVDTKPPLETNWATPFITFYSNATALTDPAGTGSGTVRWFGYASEDEIDWAAGSIGFASSGSLADTPPALLWIGLDKILGVNIARITAFPSFHRRLLSGQVDWDSDDLRLLFMDSTYAYDANDEVYADVVAHELVNATYPIGGFSLPNRFAETTYLTAGTMTLAGLRGSANGMILYKNATVEGDVKPLLAYFAFNDWTPIHLSGGHLKIRWNPPGLFILN